MSPDDIVKFANGTLYRNGVGANNGDVIFLADKVSESDVIELYSDTGAMQVFASLDGVNFSPTPLALTDKCNTTPTLVNTTVAQTNYGYRGKALTYRVVQSGATAVTKASLLAGNLGSRW